MPPHAEKNPIEIENYYHIIDPKRKLSKKERAEEVNRVLVNMPACFPEALRYVMTHFGFTQEALAFESKVSESTIGRYRNGKVKSFSEKNVVALCVAMHLPPWLSFELIAKAGFTGDPLTCKFSNVIEGNDNWQHLLDAHSISIAALHDLQLPVNWVDYNNCASQAYVFSGAPCGSDKVPHCDLHAFLNLQEFVG